MKRIDLGKLRVVIFANLQIVRCVRSLKRSIDR